MTWKWLLLEVVLVVVLVYVLIQIFVFHGGTLNG